MRQWPPYISEDQSARFFANSTHQFNVNRTILYGNDIGNGVWLSADVRLCLDHGAFVPYPANNAFVAQFIKTDYDYAEQFHRRHTDIQSNVPAEFLYARFAYNVIGLVPGHPLMAKILVPLVISIAKSGLENAKPRAGARVSRIPSELSSVKEYADADTSTFFAHSQVVNDTFISPSHG